MTKAIKFNLGEEHRGFIILEMPDPELKLVDSAYKCKCLHCGNVFKIKHSTILLRYRNGIDHCQKCPEVISRIRNKEKKLRREQREYKSYLYYVPADIKDPVPWQPTDPHGMWPIY